MLPSTGSSHLIPPTYNVTNELTDERDVLFLDLFLLLLLLLLFFLK